MKSLTLSFNESTGQIDVDGDEGSVTDPKLWYLFSLTLLYESITMMTDDKQAAISMSSQFSKKTVEHLKSYYDRKG